MFLNVFALGKAAVRIVIGTRGLDGKSDILELVLAFVILLDEFERIGVVANSIGHRLTLAIAAHGVIGVDERNFVVIAHAANGNLLSLRGIELGVVLDENLRALGEVGHGGLEVSEFNGQDLTRAVFIVLDFGTACRSNFLSAGAIIACNTLMEASRTVRPAESSSWNS